MRTAEIEGLGWPDEAAKEGRPYLPVWLHRPFDAQGKQECLVLLGGVIGDLLGVEQVEGVADRDGGAGD